MGSYFYLMAQLPGVLPNAPLSVSYQTFRETANRYLSDTDKKILAQLSLEPPRLTVSTGSTVVDKWYERERSLRFALERLRAAKMKRDLHQDTAISEALSRIPEAVQLARSVIALEDPLEAERLLDRERESFVDQLRGNHFFDSEAVFIYALQVLLHERRDLFDMEAGNSSYSVIYNQILGDEHD